ncbi:proline-rich protein 2-like isoform X5 [Serinus canaria]|uniref:proline-rich protein 2-like isoform X5 n=1 Tax=Serinus canaria TaxID=9135 RepID=UPI0021CCDD7A|nr:proline-rich protein 2-like isoform X5 [Serinus canaria]
MAAKRIPQLLGPSGRMFPPPGCRRSFPREPAPWWDGPWPGHPGGPEDAWDGPPWDGPPWEEQPRRRRRRRCPPSSRTFPGPGDGPWNEEEGDRRWAPPGCPLPPPWGDREAVPGAEDDFGECWYRDPPPDPWPEYPEEEQPQPWSPSGSPGNPGNFHQHRPPWSHRPRQSHPRLLIPVPRAWCPRPSRGLKPRSKPSCPAPSRRSQPAARKEPEPPQPPAPPRGAAERPEQPQDVPVGTGNVLEPPSPARSPRESPAADPGAAEPQVELEAEQIPEGSQDRDPCAPGTDPAPPEETSRHAEVQEHLESIAVKATFPWLFVTRRWSPAVSPRLAAATGHIPRAQQPLQSLPRGNSWNPAALEGLSSAHIPGNSCPVELEKLRQKLPRVGLCVASSSSAQSSPRPSQLASTPALLLSSEGRQRSSCRTSSSA